MWTRWLILGALAGGFSLVTTSEAWAHGGTYRGPGDTGGGGGGGDNTGGGNGQPGPTTGGGPVGPTTGGGGGPGGPVTGGGGGKGPGTGGGTGAGKKNRPVEGREQWQFWWEYNKDRYLDLKSRLGSGAPKTGSNQYLLGSKQKMADNSYRPSQDEVNSRIVPTLKSVLGENEAEIVDSAVLALGRTVGKDSAAVCFEDIKKVLGSEFASARQSAVLSLGVLGSPDAVPMLLEIMNDSKQGRQYMNAKGKLQSYERAFAAISLGFIGSPDTIDALKDTITKNENSEIDLRACAIQALGLYTESKDKIVPFLVDLMKDEKMNEDTAAQIPIALARLGEQAEVAVNPLLKMIKAKKSPGDRIEESAIIALGQLSKPKDKEVVEALIEKVKDGQNDQSRHFAMIALAEIASKAVLESAEDNAELLTEVNEFLSKELDNNKRQAHAPWAALALAIIGKNYPESASARIDVTSKIAAKFDDENNKSYKSACAIALGLLDAKTQCKSLFAEMEKSSEKNEQGYIAVSLGLMRYDEAKPTLNKMVKDDSDADLRLQVATALGLMGDVDVVKTLVTALAEAKTLNVISSLAKAVGLIGDRSAIEPLSKVVDDKKAAALARGFGCVALGLLAEKTNLPWNEKLTGNSNYRASVPALREIQDIL